MEASYAKSSKQNNKHAQTSTQALCTACMRQAQTKKKKQNVSCHEGTNTQEAQLKGHYLLVSA